MTSGMDVAKHFYLPALNEDKFHQAIITLCPYSILPFAVSLYVSDIDFLMFQFCKNDCDTWQRWVKADDGEKPERTMLDNFSERYIEDILEEMMKKVTPNGKIPLRYTAENEVYRVVY
jgi:hypothetical protein